MTTTDAPPRRTLPTWQYAVAIGLPPTLTYWLTMAPGLIARGDVPKFQYLGAILGTAHSPGYPLFIELSWLFSQLPFGTVAWRVNLMTMLFGVAAAMSTAWAARECGASRAAALVAAWGLAFGAVFWEQATAAEVYTLAIALHSTVLALAIRWRRTRRDRDLLWAVAIAAIALGHHPTFAMTVPALAIFVLATDWRVATRPKIVVATLALVAAGLAQYAYIFLRTRQVAPFLEVQAASLTDLISALSGEQYDTSFNAFTGSQLISNRLPLLSGVILNELTIAGVVLAAIGFVWLAARAWRTAVLLALTGAIVFGFTITYDVPDYPVFLTPLFAVAWIAAAVGLEAITGRLPSPAARGRLAAGVAIGLAALMIGRGYAAHDLSRDTRDRAFLDAMFEQVATPVTFVFDRDGPLSHAVRYKMFVDRAALGRVRVAHVDDHARPVDHLSPERAVYAFEEGRALFETRGILMSPVDLFASLTDRPLPRGTTLAVAMSAEATTRLLPEDLEFLRRAGAAALRPGVAQVMVLRDGAFVVQKSGGAVDATASPTFAADRPIGIKADATTAQITYGPEIVGSTAAVFFAIDSAGRPLWSDAVDRARGLRPLLPAQLPLYRAVGEETCGDAIGTDWLRFDDAAFTTRLSEWMPRRPVSPQRVTIFASSDEGAVALAGHAISGEDIDVTTTRYDRDVSAERAAIDAMLETEKLTLPGRFVTRLEHSLQETSRTEGASAIFALWPRPNALAARAATGTPLRVCLPPVRGVASFGDDSEARVELIRAESDAIGAGWHDTEGTGMDLIRWTKAARAETRVSLATVPQMLRIVVQGGPQRVREGDTIAVEVNGRRLPAQPLGDGQRFYAWDVGEGVFKIGYNSVVLIAPPPETPASIHGGDDRRPLGLGVRALTIELVSR